VSGKDHGAGTLPELAPGRLQQGREGRRLIYNHREPGHRKVHSQMLLAVSVSPSALSTLAGTSLGPARAPIGDKPQIPFTDDPISADTHGRQAAVGD